MSRLFGFFGTSAVNISCTQKEMPDLHNPLDFPVSKADGWGIGFYRNNTSFLFKKAPRLLGDKELTGIAEVMASHVFISQLRYASVGERKEANTQPFRWGNWLFAHLGTFHHFRKLKPRIARKLPSAYKKQIRGNTDSEHFFYLYLTMLRGEGAIKKGAIPIEAAANGLKKCGRLIDELCEEAEVEKKPELNLITSNGEYFLAARSGAPLYYMNGMYDDTVELALESRNTGMRIEIKNIEKDTRFTVVAAEKMSGSHEWKEIPERHFIEIDTEHAIRLDTW